MGAVFDIFNSPNTFRMDHAKWAGDKQMREARNQKEVAFAALKNFQTSEASKRRVEAAGKEYNRNVNMLTKGLQQTVATGMNVQMAAAQSLGSLEAQAAALGVGGSSMDLLSDLTKMQRNVQLEANEQERKSLSVFGMEDAVDGLDGAWQAIDNSIHFANLDYSTQIEPSKLKNRWGAMIGIAVATYFGGPQAGEAAANTTMASYKAQQGDLESSRQYMSNAVNSAAAAYQEWSQLQDGSGKSKSWFQAVRDRNTQSREALAKSESRANVTREKVSMDSWNKSKDSSGSGANWGF